MALSSAQPRRVPWRRIAAWTAGAVGVLLLVALVALATAPRWGAKRVGSELEERVGRRLGVEVEIGELELSWREAKLRDVDLRGPDLRIHIEEIDATLEREALWSGRVEFSSLAASGGVVEGTRVAVERFGRRLVELGGDDEDPSRRGWLSRRMQLTPAHAELSGLRFSIRDAAKRRVTGTVAATIEPRARRVELEIRGLLAELGLGRPLRARAVRSSIGPGPAGEPLSFPLAVELEGLAAEVDENIAVAGVHGSVTVLDARASSLRVDLAGGFADLEAEEAGAGGDLWSISGQFARDFSAGKVAVDMEAFELGRVPEVLAKLPLEGSEDATVGGHLVIDVARGRAKLDGQLELAGLDLSHRLLAREVIHDVGFAIELDAELDPAARHLTLDRLAITRKGVELRVHGELTHTAKREDRRYTVELEIPPVGCQKVLEAIPRELVPGLVGFELEGEFAAEVSIDADFSKLSELMLEGSMDMDGCRVVAAPRIASAQRLSGGFVHRVTMRDGRSRRLRLVSGSTSYTSLDSISRYMTEAVLTTEDGSFRRHDGFNRNQLEVALRRNLEHGKVRLGASTITMQMVKNVLLSHERTLSRKLQELFLTWWVEQALTKQRIMELYLNVIEFGPGIYGVTNASRHYFGKHPGELSSLEAAYLALMLPSPVRRHVHYCNGELSERFANKLAWIHDLMLERERITAEEHAVYSAIPLRFDLLERGDPELCLAEIETLMAGNHTQRALSGLLGDGTEIDQPWELASGEGTRRAAGGWGVRPPLPTEIPVDLEPGLAPGGPEGAGDPSASPVQRPERIDVQEPARGWMVPSEPVDDDPANSDAPGRPAMDE